MQIHEPFAAGISKQASQ